jgi:hypothetical protein
MRRPLQIVAALVSALAVTVVAVVAWRSETRVPAPSGGHRDTQGAPAPEPEIETPPGSDGVGGVVPEVLIDPELRVDKGARTLMLLSDGEPVKRYAIALGSQPVGDKEREGDGRTPEGLFYVCVKNATSDYHRSLGLSYPAEEDADRGLAEGMINSREHRAIVTAIRRMERPPWKTALGGEIGIHGGGSQRGDWTQGCIALENEEAEELFDALPLGTPVEIRP